MTSKIYKNEQLALKVPVACPCGSLDHQNGHSGHQNGASRSPKLDFLDIESDPFQQSTCQQLPVEKGPAAGGEALK